MSKTITATFTTRRDAVVICTYSAIFVSTPSLIYIGLMLSGAKNAQRESGLPQAAE